MILLTAQIVLAIVILSNISKICKYSMFLQSKDVPTSLREDVIASIELRLPVLVISIITELFLIALSS